MAVLTVGLGAPVAVFAAVSCIPDLASQAPTDAGTADQTAIDQLAPEGGQPRCGDGVVQLSMGEQCDPGPSAGDAGANGCGADCRMQCDGGFVWTGNNHCYLEQAAAESIMVAAGRCGVANPHVVTFASYEELGAVAVAIDAGAFWVGLQPDDLQTGYYALAAFEPGWSTTCPGCYARTSDPTQALPGDGGLCVRGFADLSRSWEEIACADGGYHRLICEREPTGRQSTLCEAGVCIDLVITSGMKHYVYVRDVASADDAEQHCRSLGGTLVVLQTRDEREQLWKELARLPGVPTPLAIWIGLSVVDGGSPEAGPWIWDDDAAADAYPSAWGDLQPFGRQTRAYLYQNGGATPQLLDDTLGRNDTAKATPTFPYVCQLTP